MIKDSGSRTSFETGAVRDIQEGKGRCDLMPLDVVGELLDSEEIIQLSHFKETGDVEHLYSCLRIHCCDAPFFSIERMLLEVSKHFEEGAEKYGENNWQLGLPVKGYLNSAIRHYLKYCNNENDEPHERAFVWNILCCIWTVIHKPEMNDLINNDGCKDLEFLTELAKEESLNRFITAEITVEKGCKK